MGLDPASLVQHWGYAAVFVIVILGNVGLPVPEETVLLLAGYLVWEGHLSLFWVLTVGIAAAVIGDSLGYWLGHRVGRGPFERHGRHVGLTAERLARAQQFVRRHGAYGVFVARFVPGFRCAAGPVAGILGVPFRTFAVANVAGALAYVPLAVGLGYGLSRAFGEQIARIERFIQIEHVLLAVALLAPVCVFVWYHWRPRPRSRAR